MSTVTEEAWGAKGVELFGEDQKNWEFVCPQCGNVESIKKIREQHAADLPTLRSAKYLIDQECIGRHLKWIGCNWAAYGLFAGPLFVERGGGKKTPCFDFAGKPFTGEAAA